jgi:SAM-dependent methyltransferase
MKCRICANEAGNKEFRVREMMFGLRDEFIYFMCAECGCLQIGEIPNDMSKYYPSRYCSFPAKKYISENRLLRMVVRLRDRYAFFNRGFTGKLLYARFPFPALRSLSILKLGTQARILDVGCGSGSVLHALRSLGFEKLLGVDAYINESIESANGVRILKGTILDIDSKFDVIMFHHSFEHVESPHETLGAANKLLADDGVCVIRIPVVDSWAWEHYGTNWCGIDAPRHFFLHSRRSMEVLCKKTAFEITRVTWDSGSPQFWGSEQYKKDMPLCPANTSDIAPTKGVFSWGEIRQFERRAKELNAQGRGDSSVFYLKKC